VKISLLTLHIQIPGCGSLKEKRGRIKPLLAGLHREYNLSVAEVDYQDKWQDALIACVLVSNDTAHSNRVMQAAIDFLSHRFPDLELVDQQIEWL
jgi:uncharacterized protein YlxP (DUF503 family)